MQRPPGVGAFEFVILASLRAAQLMRGCVPRVSGDHKNTVMAQLEVSQELVMQASTRVPAGIGVLPEDTLMPATAAVVVPQLT
jgi:hypothetical protein